MESLVSIKSSSQSVDLNVSHLRFLVISDDELIAHELLFSLQKIGVLQIAQAHTFRFALATIKTEKFDCIVVDKDLADGDGIGLAPIIRRIDPKCISILISTTPGWAMTEAARELGFAQVIAKGATHEELLRQVKELFTSTPPKNLEDAMSRKSKIHLLSEREREILIDISTGKRNLEIAAYRHISEATIKSHLASIYRKLEVRNRVEAIAAIRN